MKKCFVVITALVVLGTASLSAQQLFTFGVGVGYTSQAVTSSSTVDLTSVSFNMAEFYGRGLGFYGDIFVGTNLSAQYAGASIELPTNGMNYDMDMLFGLGYLIPVGPSLLVIVGGGAYFGAIFIQSFDYASSTLEDVALSVGAGAGATLAYRLGGHFFLAANVMAAYGFFDPMEISTSVSGNGLRILVGAGI
ncbi:MAG TPA: hypothetical protein VHE79_09450, partial [Spirochaetia bacterium]